MRESEPHSISSTEASSGTASDTAAQPARSSGPVEGRAPSATHGSAFSGAVSKTATSQPSRSSARAIGWPRLSKPTNPIRALAVTAPRRRSYETETPASSPAF
jgi:hypothetical protein